MGRYLDMYRDIALRKYGYEASSDRIGWGAPVYVGETDEQAVNEARPHIEALFNVLLPKATELWLTRIKLRKCLPHFMAGRSFRRELARKAVRIVSTRVRHLPSRLSRWWPLIWADASSVLSACPLVQNR